MLTNPSIRCPDCSGFELTASFVTYEHGGRDVSSLTCNRCGCSWEAWETPQFAAPSYALAYAGAPGLVDEELALVLLAEGIKDRATAALTGQGPNVESGCHRLVLLRKAAYLDRAAREIELGWFCGTYPSWLRGTYPDWLLDTRLDNVVDDASTKAARAGFELLKFDLDHGQVHVEGPVGPGSPEWDIAGGTRAYVRSEYWAWQEVNRAAADRAQSEPRRGADGELYDGEGTAL
ncbi:hypothetical protein [Streptomyces sp. NPDC058701]|uniref:hypothetical protein n=1 Tax=Streptomyces sp. NPDC058701 TaxID=3346608 RepID=UPI003669F9CE